MCLLCNEYLVYSGTTLFWIPRNIVLKDLVGWGGGGGGGV